MSDYLKRAFQTQLNTTMDSLLRRAVFEIMTVFENSIHDHQMELAHKGEEVVQLKIKLQTAELKLRERECAGDGVVELNKTPVNETRRQVEAVQNTPGQTSDVPEIDVEVPDDWCAPLGCESVSKKNEDVCPSVRLRPLSIPLWNIPIKQEVGTYRIDSQQQIKDLRRSKRGYSLNKKHKNTQDRNLPLCEKGSQISLVRTDKKFVQEMKKEYSAGLGLRRRSIFIGKGQENTVKTRREEQKLAEIKPTKPKTEKNDGEKTYSCKFCKKVFDTPFGLTVHVRSHKRCQGCKKVFPFPSALRYHTSSCEKLQNLLAKRTEHANSQQNDSCEEVTALPSKQNVNIKQEHLTDSRNHSKSSVQNDSFNKMHNCTYCNKMFLVRHKLKQHMSYHIGEKPFTCSMCPKKFHINKALKNHMTRMHKDQTNPSETNAWTKPLEDTEDNRDDLISFSDNIKHTKNRKRIARLCSTRWKTVGLRNSDGFICSFCKKFVRTKRQLVEHVRLHTGEMPIKCEKCPRKFRTCAQLCQHKKRGCSVTLIQCEKCQKTFPSQARYNKHLPNCQKKWHCVCKVCGKGFFYQGSLASHMKRFHS